MLLITIFAGVEGENDEKEEVRSWQSHSRKFQVQTLDCLFVHIDWFVRLHPLLLFTRC